MKISEIVLIVLSCILPATYAADQGKLVSYVPTYDPLRTKKEIREFIRSNDAATIERVLIERCNRRNKTGILNQEEVEDTVAWFSDFEVAYNREHKANVDLKDPLSARFLEKQNPRKTKARNAGLTFGGLVATTVALGYYGKQKNNPKMMQFGCIPGGLAAWSLYDAYKKWCNADEATIAQERARYEQHLTAVRESFLLIKALVEERSRSLQLRNNAHEPHALEPGAPAHNYQQLFELLSRQQEIVRQQQTQTSSTLEMVLRSLGTANHPVEDHSLHTVEEYLNLDFEDRAQHEQLPTPVETPRATNDTDDENTTVVQVQEPLTPTEVGSRSHSPSLLGSMVVVPSSASANPSDSPKQSNSTTSSSSSSSECSSSSAATGEQPPAIPTSIAF